MQTTLLRNQSSIKLCLNRWLLVAGYFLPNCVVLYLVSLSVLLFCYYLTSTNHKKGKGSLKIAVLTIYNKEPSEYQLALDTFRCYCAQRKYSWIETAFKQRGINEFLSSTFQFFFKRHCIAAEILEKLNADYIMMIDADNGVINPNRFIEEFILEDKDLIFYDRIYDNEVAAGIKNINYVCFKLNIKRVFVYIACIRILLEKDLSWKKRIAILPKRTAWVRDSWLTDSKWCENDFIIHGWKQRYFLFFEHNVYKFLSALVVWRYCNLKAAVSQVLVFNRLGLSYLNKNLFVNFFSTQ
ncbi:unnamed protein product [Enterobius vermicularis]|uniref:Glyco_trans_2-like domain-containing protein n=1 Tax=Enterobius vermicularis TaxID=51028 RepID=A0A0N4VKA0_ENTVE|nr:unnamed protein product [Enterobius vermicularis]